jgi:hypothetical protein
MITVVYCTRELNPLHTEHIKKTSGIAKYIEVIEIINNGESLTKSYNRGLKQAKNDIVVFMHDDVEFDTTGWGNKLIKHFNNNPEHGILGLAGTTDMPLTGRWWEDRTKMVGIVNHKNDGKKWESKYSKNWGDEIVDVLVVDGLFFAVHKQRIKETFDETVEGFHFYEITFGFSNHLKGVKIGVIFNVRVTHMSIGATNEQWENNRQEFVKKFNDDLPEKLIPNFYNPKDSNNSNNKVKIKVVIQSFGDVEKFNILYNKIKSFNYTNLNFSLITNQDFFDIYKNLNLDDVKIFKGWYDTLLKNTSILKLDNQFITNEDELVVFMDDNLEIINNIFLNFSKIYSSNKSNFGCIFPLSYNQNKTVFCSSLEIFANKEGKIAINMKDKDTYYNVHYGTVTNSIGNLSDCFVTTPNNLKMLDWFKLDYETNLYFNDFSLKLHLKNKTTFNDTNSLTVQKSFSDGSNIQKDLQNLINFIGSDEKLKKLVKIIE